MTPPPPATVLAVPAPAVDRAAVVPLAGLLLILDAWDRGEAAPEPEQIRRRCAAVVENATLSDPKGAADAR